MTGISVGMAFMASSIFGSLSPSQAIVLTFWCISRTSLELEHSSLIRHLGLYRHRRSIY
jgi:hypothetical protein